MPTRTQLRLLSHREDIHCVIFHLLVVACYCTAFYIYLHPEIAGLDTVGDFTAFIAAAALMLGWISGIDTGVNYHNHVHREIFRVKSVNRWFARFWTIVSGWPAFCWKHSHATVHHENILGPEDWTLPRRNSDGKPESIFTYSLAFWPWRVVPRMWNDFTHGRIRDMSGRDVTREMLLFLLLWILPFLIDPLMAILLWVLPQFIANVLVMGPGMYAQHYGCDIPDKRHPFSHSNTFLSRFFNLTMFNIGYHIEHHQWPSVHWSALPRTHNKARKRIIEGGGHIVPFGYYRGGQLLSSWFFPGRGRKIFLSKHPDCQTEDLSQPGN